MHPSSRSHNRSRVLLPVIAMLILTACSSAEDRRASYIERGRTEFVAANYDKARIAFKNALQIDARDADARYELGRTLEALEDMRGAVSQYLGAIESAPDHLPSRLAVAKIYLLGNAIELAREQIERASQSYPADADVLALRGTLKAREDNIAGAIADADAALAIDTDNINALSLRASLHLLADEHMAATLLLEDAIGRHPKDRGLRTALATLYSGQGHADRAAELFEEIVAIEPKIYTHRRLLAQYYQKIEQPDRAEQTLRDAIVALPDEAQPRLELINLLAKLHGADAALTETRRLIAAYPEHHELRFGLARLLQTSGAMTDAAAVYEGLIAMDDDGPLGLRARNRLADMAVRAGDPARAQALCEAVLSVNPADPDALLMSGKLALLNKDASTAITHFRTALHGVPDSAEINRLLAQAHAMNGDVELAGEALERALDRDPRDTETRLALAQMHSNANRFERAIRVLEAGLEIHPDDHAILAALATIRRAREAFPTAAANAPAAPATAALAASARRVAARLAELEAAVDATPTAAEPLAELVMIYMALQRPDHALARLDAAIAAKPSFAPAYNLKGEVLLKAQRANEAPAQFQAAVDRKPSWALPYRGLAMTQVQLGDIDGAITTYRHGILATDHDPLLVIELARYLAERGQIDDAIAVYEATLAAKPALQEITNGLALLLLEHRGDEASLARAAQLAATLDVTAHPQYLGTLGWAHFKHGDRAQAIVNLTGAISRLPDAAELHYRLGMVLAANGDLDQARLHLTRALAGRTRYDGRAEARAALAELGPG